MDSNVGDRYELFQLLHRLCDDIQERVDIRVEGKLLPCGKHSLWASNQVSRVFAYATIKPRKHCLSIATWEKWTKNCDPNEISDCLPTEKGMHGERGLVCEIGQDDDAVFQKAVQALAQVARVRLEAAR